MGCGPCPRIPRCFDECCPDESDHSVSNVPRRTFVQGHVNMLSERQAYGHAVISTFTKQSVGERGEKGGQSRDVGSVPPPDTRRAKPPTHPCGPSGLPSASPLSKTRSSPGPRCPRPWSLPTAPRLSLRVKTSSDHVCQDASSLPQVHLCQDLTAAPHPRLCPWVPPPLLG